MKLNPVLAALAACAALGLSPTADAQTRPAAKPLAAKPLNVAFLVYKNVEVLDLSGPMDVFIKANGIAPNTYRLYTVGVDAGLIPAEGGILTISPRYTLANCPKPDILVVPGAPMSGIKTLSANRPFIDWLDRKSADSRLTMSVCTGAFLLAKTGALDGKKSTTHWFVLDSFQQEFPRTSAMQGVRFVEDGKFVTAAGISSGIDGALRVVEKTKSKQVADIVARAMQYRRNTPAYPEQPRGKVKTSPIALKSTPRASGQKLFSNTDPICGMTVDARAITYQHQGHLYGFCSEGCRKTFAANPAEHLK